jgi:hypothetical protein
MKWMLAAPAILFLYYLIAWYWIGPEPKPKAVVARYEPPEGLSPAAARYISIGLTDGRSFAAVIAQLAVRGCLRAESVNGKLRLSRLLSYRSTDSELAPEEKRLLALLFEDGPVMELNEMMDDRSTAQNSRYILHIHEQLTKNLGEKYFTRHPGIVALGALATFLFFLPLAVNARGRDGASAFMPTFWILICGLLIGLLIEFAVLSSMKTAVRAKWGWRELFPNIWLVATIAGITAHFSIKLAANVSLSFALILAAALLINLGWAPGFKRKTPLGRQASDQIAGFRQFLLAVEQDRLDRLTSPRDAPDDLARHLPYAIALEVKETWGDHLAQSFLGTVIYTAK